MKACLFDIDGTLVQTGGAGVQAFAQTFAEEFGVPEISRSISFAGRSDRAIAGDLLEIHELGDTPENWSRFQAGYLPRLTKKLAECVGTVLPGVVALLDKLEAQGDVQIGLLTGNIRRGAEAKLSHYGLWDRFAFGGFGDDLPMRDDIAAASVALARARHQAEPLSAHDGHERVVVIGDTPNDITCAHAIGALAVGVPTGHTPVEVIEAEGPDLVVDTLEDDAQILAWFA
ncbi:Phosphoglycolate phosphatase [Pseudobythopirellula maris]|uniref:phosphoglycolate phosphatase n=1 Tax=Pseudobythopirellula maris TaxID=2527991 RepID=A0A5C5ZS95_9BACT|nr:HAD family hydrolase [Pseudobythopirellula maris]TWT90096.1 Phosphoglycolate phosphatase [Pseudobythopirellula maris]